jgi:hypothetical protein
MTSQERFLRTAARLADVTLVTTGIAAFVVFVYFFYLYSVTGSRHFSSLAYYFLYYGGPLSLTVGAFAALKLKPPTRISLAISGGTTLVLIFALDVFLERYTRPAEVVMLLVEGKEQDPAALEKTWGVKIDERRADEVIAALRGKGGDAVPFVSPGNNPLVKQADGTIKPVVKIDGEDVLPLGGVSNRLTVLCNENGYWVQYTSDERGFNNPSGIWREEHLQIAAVGDSFTQGYCVPPDKSFVGRIRERYPATLNLGMAGNGPLLTLATLREYVPRFKPSIVLWFYCEDNDLVELQQERRSPLLPNYERADFAQPALARQDAIDRAILDEIAPISAIVKEQRDRSNTSRTLNSLLAVAKLSALRRASDLVGAADDAKVRVAAAEAGPNIEAFREILSLAKAEVAAWGGEMYFVYLPGWGRFANTPPSKDPHDAVTEMVRGLAIPLIDLEPPFRASGAPLGLFPFGQPGHYNEQGHTLVAEQVLKALPAAIATK